MRVREISRALNLPPGRVYHAIRSGALPAKKVNGEYEIAPASIRQFQRMLNDKSDMVPLPRWLEARGMSYGAFYAKMYKDGPPEGMVKIGSRVFMPKGTDDEV